jgi:uncharacterized protein YhhL (DUF1145 family)
MKNKGMHVSSAWVVVGLLLVVFVELATGASSIIWFFDKLIALMNPVSTFLWPVVYVAAVAPVVFLLVQTLKIAVTKPESGKVTKEMHLELKRLQSLRKYWMETATRAVAGHPLDFLTNHLKDLNSVQVGAEVTHQLNQLETRMRHKPTASFEEEFSALLKNARSARGVV